MFTNLARIPPRSLQKRQGGSRTSVTPSVIRGSAPETSASSYTFVMIARPCYLHEQWNGTSLLGNHISRFPDIVVYSDASGSWGCGVLTGRTWLKHQWIPGAAEAFSIAHKEFVSIIMVAAIWGGQWAGRVVQFQSDNESVVIVLNKLSSKDKQLSHLLKCIVFMAAKNNFWFTVSNIQGRNNILADAIFRNNRVLFLQQAPIVMDRSPSMIPRDLPNLLYMTPPDWLDLSNLGPAVQRFRNSMQLV